LEIRRDVIFSFFFQAEDGIRVFHVTGVQTCALPISSTGRLPARSTLFVKRITGFLLFSAFLATRRSSSLTYSVLSTTTKIASARSEERRVGKECWSRRDYSQCRQ